MEALRVHEGLGYGAIGLGLLLAVLAFRLLRREQQLGSPPCAPTGDRREPALS